MMNSILGRGALNLWDLIEPKAKAQETVLAPNQEQPQEESPFGGLPERVKIPQMIDDATNKPLPLKSISVSRPMGYARPATEQDVDIDALINRFGDASDNARAQQAEGVQDLEGRIRNYEKSSNPWEQANLGPLLAIADSMNNTNTLAGYKAPPTGRDEQLKSISLEQELQKRKGDLSKEEADSLKDRINFYLKGQDDPMAMLRYQLALGNQGDRKNNHGDTIGIQLLNQWRTDPVTKNTQEVATAFEKVKSSSTNTSPAGDLSLIFNYMKMLDPGSVVREGEFATAQNAAGVPDRVVNMYNKLLKGERLNPNQRKDFSDQAWNTYNAQMAQQERFNQGYEDTARGYGLDPGKVVLRQLFKGVEKPGGKKTKAPVVESKEGDTKVWDNKTYILRNGQWVKK